MKQKLILCIMFLSMCISVACGTKKNPAIGNVDTDNPVVSTTIDPLPEPSVTEIVDNQNYDPFVGEYNDFDFDEPNLEIEKKEDGSYEIEIGIYRISTFRNCIGILVDDKIEFHKDISNGKIKLEGVIEFDGDIATVTFTSKDWLKYSHVTVYPFEKSSDKPFDKHEKLT